MLTHLGDLWDTKWLERETVVSINTIRYAKLLIKIFNSNNLNYSLTGHNVNVGGREIFSCMNTDGKGGIHVKYM